MSSQPAVNNNNNNNNNGLPLLLLPSFISGVPSSPPRLSTAASTTTPTTTTTRTLPTTAEEEEPGCHRCLGGGGQACHSSSPSSSPADPSSLLRPGGPSAASSESSSYLYLYKQLPPVSCDTDYERLGRSMHGLMEGCFYYQDLDSNGARALLERAPEGTFLVRDSSDSRFLFSLTVKTERGATSVRIQYQRGFFQLDCEDQMKRKLPR